MLYFTYNSIKHQSFVYTQLNDLTGLFHRIPFRISTQFSFISPVDKTLSGSTTPGKSGPGSNANNRWTIKGYWKLTIRLFSVISRTLVRGLSPTYIDAVGVFYSQFGPQRHSLGVGLTLLHRCSWCILQPQPTEPDCLVPYPGHLLVSLTTLHICSWCILKPQLTGPDCLISYPGHLSGVSYSSA